MAKLQEDWVFIGLGLGAVYLVYKLTNPISKVVDSASDLSTNVLGKVNDAVNTTSSSLFDKVTGNEKLNTPGDYVTASGVTLFKKLVDTAARVFNTNSNTQIDQIINTSTASKPDPSKTQILTNIAASKNIVSVAPPQMSLASNASISPFTGQAYAKVVDTKKADLFKQQWESARSAGQIKA